MSAIQIVAIVFASLTVISIAALVLLPRHIQVIRSAKIAAQPQQVIALAASNQGYQTFNPYRSTDPKLKIDLFGPLSGVGSGFKFHGKDGKGSQVVTAVSAERVDYQIDLGPMGRPTQSLRAVPSENGTQVEWRMNADLGMNPVARVFGLFMDGMVGKTFETGLQNLASAATN